jgi:hypothetical protein
VGINILRMDIHAVPEGLSRLEDIQGCHGDLMLLQIRWTQITGAVGADAYGHTILSRLFLGLL